MAWKTLEYNTETGQMRTSDGTIVTSLANLTDTSIESPEDGQFLGYDGTEEKWVNKDVAAGGNVDDVLVNGVSVVDANKEAKITSYKEVTQAQYEALPDSKLTDGILYAIKDGGQAIEGFPPLIYSDQEREIGVWRDGKPLYQKSYHFNASILTVSSGWEPLDTTINGEKLISLDISTYHTVYLESRAVKIRSDEVNVIPRFQISSGNFNYHTSSANFAYSGSDYEWDITIQYTKTTDTPGSGTWNSQGAIAHHYSTAEQVIGTWIDGKPLYEITAEFSSEITVNNNTWTNTTMPTTDKKAIVNVIGTNSTGTCWNMLSANCDNGSYVQVYHSRNTSITLKMLTIQYTKTTD